MQTEHHPAQAEIPTSLKCIGLSGANDCVCQPLLPRFYNTFLFGVPLSLQLVHLQLQLSSGDEVNATCHSIQCGVFAKVKQADSEVMESHLLSCGCCSVAI